MPRRDDDRDDKRNDAPRGGSKKNSKTWLWIGLGCGCLFLIGIVVAVGGSIGAYYFWPSGGAIASGVPPSPKIKEMPGLIAYWTFDDVKGKQVTDHSGKNNHLTLVGGKIDKGKRGNALWLDGTVNQYCEIPPSPDFNFPANGGFGFSGWVKTPLQDGAIVSLTSSKGPQQIDFIIRQNKFLVVVGDDNDRKVQNAFVWSKGFNDNQWRHFAFAREGNKVHLWIDGNRQGEMQAFQSGGAVTTDLRAIGSERIWITTNEKKWGNPSFEGGIDEVCVFNRTLTQADIQILWEAGR